MNHSPRSWASSIVGFALAVLLAGWALHTAAELVLSVWPVLALSTLVVLTVIGLIRRRDRW